MPDAREMTDGPICIWCGQRDPSAAEEHIVPEALGCPPTAVFRDGEVCSRCNNLLSRWDQALCDGFDLLRLAYGQPGKKGGPPAVSGRPNARTVRRDGQNVLEINFGPNEQMLPDGRRLKAPTKSLDSIHGTMERGGDIGKVTYRAHLFYQEHFVRGIYKIALESFALHAGWQAARDSSFDPIRSYVLDPKAEHLRCVVHLRSGEQPVTGATTELFSPYAPETGAPGYVVPLRLLNVVFFADLTPGQQFVEHSIARRSFFPDAFEYRVLPWDMDPWLRTAGRR